jgi:hypothetical protein
MHPLIERIRQTADYLKLLGRSFTVEWPHAYAASGGETDWKFRMALIHPDHYAADVRTSNDCPIRGPRSFQKEVGLQKWQCAAKMIWGYDCPPTVFQGTLAADHLFPFGFGGPTLPSNKIYLCQHHNMIKGADLHFYPWENTEPEWLEETIRRIAKLKGIK